MAAPQRWKEWIPITGVLATFLIVTAAIVPVTAAVAVHDDWVFSRAVQLMVGEGRLYAPDVSAPSLVAQTIWGAMFSSVFGFSFGTLRVSTLIITVVGGAGMFGLCRELGINSTRSALTVAAYLFNPLVYVLANTFMTDIHFVSWALLAVWAYTRGLRTDDARWLAAGSAFCTAALLVRQQGIFIAASVAIVVVIQSRHATGRTAASRVLRVAALPVLAFIGYHVVIVLVRGGLPESQRVFLDYLKVAGLHGVIAEVWRLPFIQVSAVGLASVPLLVGVARHRLGGGAQVDRIRRITMGASATAVVLAFVVFSARFRLVPYAPEFTNVNGLGPPDLIGGRPALVGDAVQVEVTLIGLVATLAALLLVIRQLPSRTGRRLGLWTSPPGLVLAVFLGQFAASTVPSFWFVRFDGTLDRYMVPGVAFGLVLVCWATRDVARVNILTVLVVIVLGAVSVVGTRDYLVHESVVWRTAKALTARGVRPEMIDAGASWDGWHVSDGTLHRKSPRTQGGPWWTSFYAPATDSTFTLSNLPPQAPYVGVQRVRYDSWLHRGPEYVYVSRRPPRKPGVLHCTRCARGRR